MKKTTLWSFAFLLFFTLNATVAQNNSSKSKDKSKSINSLQSRVSNNAQSGITLNQDSQNSLNHSGYVRCVTTEMHERRLQRNPNLQTDQQFEAWLEPLVQAKKAEMAQQSANGSLQQVVVNIPVIFHIISSGGPSNVSAALVQAQIDQLNLDFSNQAGANAGPWSAVAADAEIIFIPAQVDPNGIPLAEPGIDRVTTYGSGPFNTNEFDLGDGGLEIKPNTIWDRSLYANIWSADLSGGILGYAQFPSNSTLPGFPANGGSELNDGVVIGFGTIGSVAMPGSAAPYNLGRTLTHEIGHWIGLRHIWGDGGCGVDDFCADTPLSSASNFGCVNPDSCGSPDMVQNYMDYTDDSCMNIFTTDQVARIATVLTNADGISNLPNSTVGVPIPAVYFANATSSVAEGSDCTFTDFTINMNIGDAPTANATANLVVSGGTATNNTDFELLTNTVNFNAGTTNSQAITLRVFNDSFDEGNETVELSFTVNANGGNAYAANSTFSLTINDDDINPLIGGAPIAIITENFDASGLTNWTVTGAPSATNFALANNGSIPDAGFFNTDESNATQYVYVNDDDCNCDMSNERLAYSAPIDLTGITNGIASLDYAFSDTYGGLASVEVSTDNGTTWVVAAQLTSTSTGDEDNIPFSTATVNLSAYANQTINISVHYDDEGGWAGGLVLDNFVVSSPGPSDIQTAVNIGTSGDQLNLIASGEAYALDTVTNNAILNINVLDGFSYDCTTTGVSRSGTGAEPYNGSIAPALVTNKSYNVLPSTVSPTGTSEMSFYFSEAELAGWEAATGDVRANLRIAKNNGTSEETVASTITPFGTNWKVTGNFTSGISGDYYFGNLAFLSTSEFTFDNFLMYPNPSNGSLTMSFNTANDVNVNLYDIRGREVLNKNFRAQGSKFNQTLNLATLSTGVYVVKVNSGANTMFRKLVIN